jgi:glycosyltransferase involved in cell wall biosynthesis
MEPHNLKIVHVINRLVPGGAEKQLQEIVHRSTLAQEILELHGYGEERRRGKVLRRLARELRRERPTVVIAWLERSQLAVAATAPVGTRLIAVVGGLPRRTNSFDRWLVRSAFLRFDWFVANSNASRTATTKFALPLILPHFDVIPNGVEPVAQRPRRTSGPMRIGFIGRNNPDKGLDVLLDALVDVSPTVEAVFVGVGVPDAVRAAGPRQIYEAIDRVPDPWEAIGSIDALVVPSRSEGSPNVITEAFVRGIPVIGTPAGGARELLDKDRGVIVPIGDSRALAKAINAVLANPEEARARALSARNYASAVHAWDRVVAGWDCLLRKVMTF